MTVLNNLRHRYIILATSVIAVEALAISCFRYANADLTLQKLLLHFLFITLGPLYGMYMNIVNNFSFMGILIAFGLFAIPFGIVMKGIKKFNFPLLFLGSSFWVFCGYLYAVAIWM